MSSRRTATQKKGTPDMNYAAATGLKFEDRTEGFAETLFRPSGIDGLHARTGRYEQVVDALQALVTRHREDGVEVLRFPPVMSRSNLEKSGYLHSFPHLLGAVCCLHGEEAEIRAAVERPANDGGWTASLAPTDLVLSPAACYPIYPLAAERGAVPKNGATFDVACDCFRHEPSLNLDRMQSFRMREYVFIGASEQVVEFRARWIERAQGIAERVFTQLAQKTPEKPQVHYLLGYLREEQERPEIPDLGQALLFRRVGQPNDMGGKRDRPTQPRHAPRGLGDHGRLGGPRGQRPSRDFGPDGRLDQIPAAGDLPADDDLRRVEGLHDHRNPDPQVATRVRHRGTGPLIALAGAPHDVVDRDAALLQ